MQEKRFLHCIGCGGFTINRVKGWWLHKHCYQKLQTYLHIWNEERVAIKLGILNWEKALTLLINGDYNGTDKYNEELEKEALDCFIKKYGKPFDKCSVK